MNAVIDRPEKGRFELEEEGHVAFADYRLQDGRIVIPHVEAPVALRGKGTAGRLMTGIAEIATERGLTIVPLCSYARSWLERSAEHRGLIG